MSLFNSNFQYNSKEEWPQSTIIVPGNEVLFSMETATDYLKNDLGNR